MKIAYFDCFSGISGDMTLGAFIDMGVSADWIKETIQKNLDVNFDLSVTTVSRMGIAAKQVEIIVKDYQQRNYASIYALIKNSLLPDNVRKRSLKIFDSLAEAESKIHGCSKESIHFHELGGVDAIADIVGVSLCIDYFNFEKIVSSKIPLGRGFIRCDHGTLPGPAPATLEILKNVPVSGVDIPFEFVTPTGAAIIKTLAENFGNIPDMRISKISYGAGSNDLETIPNLLRIIVGETVEPSDTVEIVETNIDDMNPEIYGFLIEKLFEDGALDVCLIPAFMKKNRPGILLQVMCYRSQMEGIISRILSETTTLGVRHHTVDRRILARKSVEIKTPFGPMVAKKVQLPDGSIRIIPEYESCRNVAISEKIPIHRVYDIIHKLVENSID